MLLIINVMCDKRKKKIPIKNEESSQVSVNKSYFIHCCEKSVLIEKIHN